MLSVQVNLATIVRNITTIKKRLKPHTKFCAVVKDNAYGFGLTNISCAIEPFVDCFAVANLEEGVALRQVGIKKDILIFGVTQDIVTAAINNLIVTIGSLDEANNLLKQEVKPRLHLAVNTDMNRYGINSIHELRKILQILPRTQITGVYTHFAHESTQPQAVAAALQNFKKYVTIIKKYCPNVSIHAGCSGVINYPAAHFNMIRIGKAMYGGTSDTKTSLTVTSQIIAIKKIKPGTTIGYNGEFKATHPMTIGIVRGGYAHGIQPAFSGTISVKVEKQDCPIIGRVCMDCFYIDVSNVIHPLGKKVTIIAPQRGQTIIEIAERSKVIACRILQGLKY